MIEYELHKMLYETNSPWLLLQKSEKTPDDLLRFLGIKPTEINILLARVVEFLKEEHPGKTKRDVIIEILEVLNRSYIAREYVGLGLSDNYKLFKGFPVRRGDTHDNLPGPGSEIELKPKDTFLSWTTDPNEGRETSATFDTTKGEPIGGLLVQINLDSGKLLFDINAVIKATKENFNIIQKYNTQSASGMAISKSNTEYLAKEAQYYTGDYEVITPSSMTSVEVIDNWEWKENNEGGKQIQWKTSDIKDVNNENEKDETDIKNENNGYSVLFEQILRKPEIPLEEGFMDFIHKISGTVRGNTLKYLQSLVNQLESQLKIYQLSRQFAASIDKNDKRVDIADENIRELKQMLQKTYNLLSEVKKDKTLGLDFSGMEE